MSLVDKKSLAATLENLNQALLEKRKLSQLQREEVAWWIASRVDASGSYHGMPAPTEHDYRTHLRLFTGEGVGSIAGAGCKLGFEATWALLSLRSKRARTASASEQCRQRATQLFAIQTARGGKGMYCCCSCSTAGWRVLGMLPDRESGRLFDAAMSILHGCRDGTGKWRRFSFWYTLLALNDLEQPAALSELCYAAPVLERTLASKRSGDLYSQRRRLLAERILERI